MNKTNYCISLIRLILGFTFYIFSPVVALASPLLYHFEILQVVSLGVIIGLILFFIITFGLIDYKSTMVKLEILFMAVNIILFIITNIVKNNLSILVAGISLYLTAGLLNILMSTRQRIYNEYKNYISAQQYEPISYVSYQNPPKNTYSDGYTPYNYSNSTPEINNFSPHSDKNKKCFSNSWKNFFIFYSAISFIAAIAIPSISVYLVLFNYNYEVLMAFFTFILDLLAVLLIAISGILSVLFINLKITALFYSAIVLQIIYSILYGFILYGFHLPSPASIISTPFLIFNIIVLIIFLCKKTQIFTSEDN